MRRNSLSLRRWGVAVLSGVTLLGFAAVVGEGVASAATAAVATAGSVSSTANTNIGPVVITEGTAVPVNDFVCLTLGTAPAPTGVPVNPHFSTASSGSSGVTFETPTITYGSGGAGSAASFYNYTTGGGNVTGVSTAVSPAAATDATVIGWQVTTANTAASTITATGVFGDLNNTNGGGTAAAATPGQNNVVVGVGTTQALACMAAANYATGVYGIETTLASVYGTTADATTAAEFLKAFNCSTGVVAHGVATVVLATDALPYDALAAADLESTFGTGLLITSPTSLDPNMVQALQSAGVTNVMVVGGPLAVSNADITALQNIQSVNCAGAVGAKITTTGPIYGATADDTAVAIDNAAIAHTALVPVALGTGSVTAYNDTTGTGNTTLKAVNTAFLVADNTTDTVSYDDAMALSPISYNLKLPVILTPSATLGVQATQELGSLGITQVFLIGGNLAISNAVVTTLQGLGINVVRIAGTDATDTAGELSKFETAVIPGWITTHVVFLTQGAQASDALGAAAWTGFTHAPLILTQSPTLGLGTPSTTALANLGNSTNQYTSIQPLGGPLALPTAQITAAVNALA